MITRSKLSFPDVYNNEAFHTINSCQNTLGQELISCLGSTSLLEMVLPVLKFLGSILTGVVKEVSKW